MALYNKKLRKAAFKKVNKGTGGVPPPPSIAKVMLFSDSAIIFQTRYGNSVR